MIHIAHKTMFVCCGLPGQLEWGTWSAQRGARIKTVAWNGQRFKIKPAAAKVWINDHYIYLSSKTDHHVHVIGLNGIVAQFNRVTRVTMTKHRLGMIILPIGHLWVDGNRLGSDNDPIHDFILTDRLCYKSTSCTTLDGGVKTQEYRFSDLFCFNGSDIVHAVWCRLMINQQYVMHIQPVINRIQPIRNGSSAVFSAQDKCSLVFVNNKYAYSISRYGDRKVMDIVDDKVLMLLSDGQYRVDSRVGWKICKIPNHVTYKTRNGAFMLFVDDAHLYLYSWTRLRLVQVWTREAKETHFVLMDQHVMSNTGTVRLLRLAPPLPLPPDVIRHIASYLPNQLSFSQQFTM